MHESSFSTDAGDTSMKNSVSSRRLYKASLFVRKDGTSGANGLKKEKRLWGNHGAILWVEHPYHVIVEDRRSFEDFPNFGEMGNFLILRVGPSLGLLYRIRAPKVDRIILDSSDELLSPSDSRFHSVDDEDFSMENSDCYDIVHSSCSSKEHYVLDKKSVDHSNKKGTVAQHTSKRRDLSGCNNERN
ncbi:Uncharacterized protein Fot_38234 [Forsythia ovata]|uniref:Uncharacterized protein n=1 Tax=Forsythia ovata TaxID=205694 RepID=A0ABD1S1C5_9LAMI